MPIASVSDLADLVRRLHLLEPAQVDELPALQGRISEPRALAGELIQRGWLTPFQVNNLFQGKGSELLLGPYVLLARLGEGGMGQVFKARHSRLGRIVALKVIRKERLVNPDAVRRFHREVRAAAQLSHPHIVLALDAGQVGETHFFAMEYVEGIDLARLVKQRGPLAIDEACDYVRQTALALQHAFEHGLVHRDIKPSNLLVTTGKDRPSPTGPNSAAKSNPRQPTIMVKVLDMGLVRLQQTVAQDDSASGTLTQEGLIMGTPDFIAPEQALDSHLADIRSDLYSLGCTLYFLLAGRAPFRGSIMEKLLKHRLEEPTPMEQLRAEVPPPVIAVMRRLMAKRPEDRFQTPAEAAAALTSLAVPVGSASSIAVAPQPVCPPARLDGSQSLTDTPANWASVIAPTIEIDPVSWARRRTHRRRWPLPVAVFLFLLCGAATGWLYWNRPAPPAPASLVQREVAAGKTWQDTHIDVREGETVTVRHRAGRWQKRGLAPCSLKGIGSASRDRVILPDAPAMCLLGRIGDGTDLVNVGMTPTIRAERGGRLFLRANDLDPELASDSLQVEIEGGSPQLTDAPLPEPTPLERAETRLRSLVDLFAVLPRDIDRIRADALDIGIHYPGCYHARRAAALARELPSVCDALDPQRLPPAVRRDEQQPSELVAVLGQHGGRHWRGRVESVVAIPSLGMVASAGEDQLVHLWDVSTGREVANLKGQTESIWSLAVTTDGKTLASGARNGWVRLWSLDDVPTAPQMINPDVGPVRAVAFSPDGQLLAIGGTTGTVVLWDMAEQKEKARLTGHPGFATCVAFAPDGQTVAVSNRHETEGRTFGQVKLWDVASAQEKLTFRRHQQGVWAVAFSPDGLTVASGGTGRRVRLWAADSGEERLVLEGTDAVFALAFAADGRQIAAATGNYTKPGDPGEVRTWDVASGRVEAIFQGHKALVRSVAWTADGQALLSAGYDQTIRQWDLKTRAERLNVPGHHQLVRDAAISPDGRKAGSAGWDGRVYLWNLQTGEGRLLTPAHAGRVNGVAFSPDGRVLASASDDNWVKLWDTATGQLMAALRGHAAGVHMVAFSPDGQTLASAGMDSVIKLWTVAGGKERATLAGHSDRVLGVAFSPDGRTLVSAGTDRLVKTWNLATGKECANWPGHEGQINWAAFSPDGRQAATCDSAKAIHLWDVVSGRPVRLLHHHQKTVHSVAYAPEGRTLLSTGDDGRVIWWDAATGKILKQWLLPGPTSGTAFAPDGRHVAVGMGNGTIYVLRLPRLAPDE